MGTAAKKINEASHHIWFQHSNADGFITLCRKNKETGDFVQYHYRPEELAEHLSNWMGEDIYFSQNTFYKPQRRIENIRQLRSLYVDLDFYLFNYDPNWILGKLEYEFYGESIPEPNLIIFSGQGVVLVWLIDPVPYQALPLWQAVQNYLLNQLKNLGGDPLANDAARVFRLAGTRSSKNGNEVHVEYRSSERYSLRDIQYEYLPELKPPKVVKKGRKKKVLHLFNIYTLNHARLMDLTKLVELRNGEVTGCREMLCFMYRYWTCCFTSDPKEALKQTLSFNSTFSAPLQEREVISATKSAEKAWKAKSNDEANKVAQELGYPGAGYNVTNRRLIEWFGITKEEMRHLKTIIDGSEKRRRKRIADEQYRRSKGIISRVDYLSSESEKTKKSLKKLIQGMEDYPHLSNRKLAKQIGLSEGYIRKLKLLLPKLKEL